MRQRIVTFVKSDTIVKERKLLSNAIFWRF